MKRPRITMFAIAVSLAYVPQSFAQTPTYELILKNDSLISSTEYSFDVYMQRTGSTTFELSGLQLIQTFNTAISPDSVSYTIEAGSSELNALQSPTNARLSVVGNELRLAPNPPPGSGAGTIIPPAPGIRVGRFRLTSSAPFTNQRADVRWKNDGANPVTKVNAYVGGTNTSVTDSTGHLNLMTDASLSPLTITSDSPLPIATVPIPYADTLTASGGTLPFVWQQTGGSLPAGLSLSADGIVSGTTLAPGTYNFTASVTDNASTVVAKAFSVTVNPGQLHHFAVEAAGGGAIGAQSAGRPFFIQIVAQDTVNNTATGFNGTAEMSSSGVLLSAGTTAPFTNGVLASNGVTIANTGLVTLSATRTGGTEHGTSNPFQVNPGAAKQIVFVHQPTNASSGAVITPAITVQLKDSLGNNSGASGVSVSLSLTTGTGTLTGTTPRSSDTTGLVTFSGMSVDLAGFKRLTAAGTGLIPALSDTFAVLAGAATHIAIIQQPTDDTAGTFMTPPPAAQLRDSAGNDVASAGITLSIALTSGSGTLSGTTSRATNASGVATFDSLSINLAGSKNLTFSGTGLAPAVSSPFTISPGPLATFLVEASGGGSIPLQNAGVAFLIRMTAKDSNNNTVTGFSGTAVVSSTGQLSSGGGTTPAFASGILSSRSVTIAAGGAFTITASATVGGAAGTSNLFTVNNQIPVAAGISPSAKIVGASSFTMGVTGSNFVPSSVVRFNGADRATTFDSSTHLSVLIPAGDLTSAGTFAITVFNPSPGGGISNPRTFTISLPVVNLRLLLEGAYNSGSMATTLQASGFLPLSQPYNTAPWTYAGGEAVGSVPAGIVDWILLELRSGTGPATRVARRAAFLKSDGSVVDTNGSTRVAIPGIAAGSYYLVVQHRIHISVMSASPVALNDSTALYDFTNGLSKYFGGEAKNLGGGKFGLFAGDYSSDGFIDATDFVGTDNELFQNGYRKSDLNMDGFIDASDFVFPDNNIFRGSNVP